MTGYLSLAETGALILSLFFVGVSFGGSSPLVSSILESRGASEYFTSGVVAMLSLGLALASPWAGRLVDRIGPRPVNVAGILLQGVGFAGLAAALAIDERLLFPARLWLGISAALTFVAAEYALLKGTRPSHRGRVMAAYGAAFGSGFMLGVFLGNRAFDVFGLAGFLVLTGVAVLIT
ncbi:MAG: MFS transporter, partial [Vicinamibacteria bacterium]